MNLETPEDYQQAMISVYLLFRLGIISEFERKNLLQRTVLSLKSGDPGVSFSAAECIKRGNPKIPHVPSLTHKEKFKYE